MGSFLRGATGTGNDFTANGANVQGQDFTGQLATANANLGSTFNNQGQLASQLQNQIAGTGPNPAAIQAQQMNENAIKSNAGMIASQKGIDPALAARTAAYNGANMQQQAAGQGALLGANQQLQAQGQLANLYGQQAGEAGGQESTLQNALAAYNNANVGMTSNINNTSEAAHAQNAGIGGGLVGGILGGASSAIGSLFAKGGTVPASDTVIPDKTQNFDMGGPVQNQNWGYGMQPSIGAPQMASSYISSGGTNSLGSKIGGGLKKLFAGQGQPASGPGSAEDQASGGLLTYGANQQENEQSGMVLHPESATVDQQLGSPGQMEQAPAMASPIADPDILAAAQGGKIPEHLMHMARIHYPDFANHLMSLKSQGGKVPGTPKVNKNSYANDTVPTMLSPKEIVLPLSVTQSKDPVKAAGEFVAKELAKSNQKKKGSGNQMSDFHDALKRAVGERRSK